MYQVIVFNMAVMIDTRLEKATAKCQLVVLRRPLQLVSFLVPADSLLGFEFHEFECLSEPT